jgi:hypothetical protein
MTRLSAAQKPTRRIYMRKLLLLSALVLIAASAFAQTAPVTNYEIYGSTFFDYQMSGTEWGYNQPALANFTFSKLRIGFRAVLADGLKSTLELDPRNGEFRHAYIDWVPVENLTLTFGKTYTNFEQIVAYYGGSRMLQAGAKYAIPGFGWVGLQFANKSDIGYRSGNDLIFPPLNGTASTAATIKQDSLLYMFPAVVVKQDLGDIKLEVGAESQIVPQLVGNDNPTGLGLDGYFTVAGFGFTFTNEFAWLNVNDKVKTNKEFQYYAQITYNAGMISPTIYLVTQAKDNFSNDPNTAIGVEIPITVAKNFKINPMFSYAIANQNAFEGNYGIAGAYDKNDWTLGLRFDYSFSAKF